MTLTVLVPLLIVFTILGVSGFVSHWYYVRGLKRRVDYLEAENRNLWNSLVGTRGFPAVELPSKPGGMEQPPRPIRSPAIRPRRKLSFPQLIKGLESIDRKRAADHAKELERLREEASQREATQKFTIKEEVFRKL